jgi:hypothetical protein
MERSIKPTKYPPTPSANAAANAPAPMDDAAELAAAAQTIAAIFMSVYD